MQNDDVRVYTPPSGKAPDATPTTLLNTTEDIIALGALDAAFARYPARVQLLLVVDAKIDERRFHDAVDAAIFADDRSDSDHAAWLDADAREVVLDSSFY